MEVGLVVLAVFAFIACAGAVVAAIVAVNSTPARVLDAVKQTREAHAELAATVESLRVAWTKYRAELEGVLEAVEDTLETTERKRRRAVSAASKVAEAEGGNSGDPLASLRRRARDQGHPV